MKNIIITYSNGDREKSELINSNSDDMIKEIIASGFKSAWFSEDEQGHYRHITNMQFVRSIEIIEDESEVKVD